jgi:hypothetical protein
VKWARERAQIDLDGKGRKNYERSVAQHIALRGVVPAGNKLPGGNAPRPQRIHNPR